MGQEKREYIDNWRDFLWENKIAEFNVKNNRCDYVYVNSTCQSEKKHNLNWTRILGIFLFHKLCLRKQRENLNECLIIVGEKAHLKWP